MKLSRFSLGLFYIKYVLYKFYVLAECSNYKLLFFLNEFRTLIHALQHFKYMSSVSSKKITVHTSLGDFHIRNMPIDLTIASPAFERDDIETLISFIDNDIKHNRHVLFIDIGANIGKYSIVLANRFSTHKSFLTLLAIEPDNEAFSLLKTNIALNHAGNIYPLHRALSSKKRKTRFYYYNPMKMIVSFKTDTIIYKTTDTLDHVIQPYLKKDSHIYIKLDAEGHEVPILLGAKKLLQSHNILLLVEDSSTEHSELINFLRQSKAFPAAKKTPYNSFWKIAEK